MKKAGPVIAVILAGCLWGVINIFVKTLSAAGLGSLQIALGRLAFAALILAVLLVGRRIGYLVSSLSQSGIDFVEHVAYLSDAVHEQQPDACCATTHHAAKAVLPEQILLSSSDRSDSET